MTLLRKVVYLFFDLVQLLFDLPPLLSIGSYVFLHFFYTEACRIVLWA